MTGLSDWARELLEGRYCAVLGTQDADGPIHLTPVWFMFRDDRVYVGASSASHRIRNILARPTASLVVDIRVPGSERWVSVSEPAEILRGDQSRHINADIRKRYLTEEALRDPKVGPGSAAADDVTVCIKPEKWRSWAAKDIDAQFFGGVLCATPEMWFLPVD